MDIRKYVIADASNTESDHEYDSFDEAQTVACKRLDPVAIIARVYVFSDSELEWTSTSDDVWPPPVIEPKLEWKRWSFNEYGANPPGAGPYWQANLDDLVGRVWRDDDDDEWQWHVMHRGSWLTPESSRSHPDRKQAMVDCEEALQRSANAYRKELG